MVTSLTGLTDDAAARTATERANQGLPPQIEDGATLAWLADLIADNPAGLGWAVPLGPVCSAAAPKGGSLAPSANREARRRGLGSFV